MAASSEFTVGPVVIVTLVLGKEGDAYAPERWFMTECQHEECFYDNAQGHTTTRSAYAYAFYHTTAKHKFEPDFVVGPVHVTCKDVHASVECKHEDCSNDDVTKCHSVSETCEWATRHAEEKHGWEPPMGESQKVIADVPPGYVMGLQTGKYAATCDLFHHPRYVRIFDDQTAAIEEAEAHAKGEHADWLLEHPPEKYTQKKSTELSLGHV